MAFAIALALALQTGSPSAALDCQAALGPLYEGADPSELPNQIDGATIGGVEALVRLRAERGLALLVVKGGSFAGADFRRANLSNICFVETDLSRTDWRGAAARGLGFIDTDLEGARLAGARLPRLLLRGANLKDVDATEADLSGGRMDGSWKGSVENLRLDRAKLRNFRFDCGITVADGCPIDGELSVAGADLTDARLATYGGIANWRGARIDRTELGLEQLAGLETADLQGPLRLRGGDTIVEISPAEYRLLRPHLSEAEPLRPASFDCAAARTAVERTICAEGNDGLRDLDGRLAELYRRARAADPAVATEQQAWLRRRDACGADAECLLARYEQRIGALHGRAGPPDWARPGAVALFIDPDVHFAPAFRDHPLYARLLPVLIDGAAGRVAVRVGQGGRIEAGGEAIGGNAHLCTLRGEGLTFDRSNGWYSGPYQDDAETPAELRGRPMPVVRIVGDTAQVYRNGHLGYGSPDPRPSDYATCGARAGFGDMIRVPVTEREVADLLAADERLE